MTTRVLAVGMLLLLPACATVSESRFNPFNWFGGSTSADTLTPVGNDATRDERPLVPTVTELRIERRPGGAILTATGLPGTQGWFDVALVSETEDVVPVNGTLTYFLRGRPPEVATRAATAASRDVVAAAWLTDADLIGVRQIRVVGAQNARAIAR